MSETARARQRGIERVLLYTLGLNLAVAAAKAVYGAWAGSLAISSDAIHSLIDASSNVLGLVVFRFATRPADPGHPYGHGKLEVVAAAAIGVSIAIVALRFAWSAVEGLLHGSAMPALSPIGFAVAGGTLVVNLWVARYEARRARELSSSFLAADAAHTSSDVMVTCAVLAAYGASYAGIRWADPVGALIVVGFIARVAYQLLSENLNVLVDGAVIDPLEVAALVREVPGVAGCHRVRSRGTEHAVHVDLHLLIDGDVTLREAHSIADRVEAVLVRELPALADVTLHMEPDDLDETPLPR